MAKPRIFVSSTYYDLKHIRNSLEAFIDSLGFDSVLFESGDIPFHHDQPIDESCYAEIHNCHMLVLIIGGRYGSPSSGSKVAKAKDVDARYERYNSITRKEYENARSRDIPIFIFVEKNVLAEYQTYKDNRDNTSVKYAHVDSVNIYRLLDDILSQRRNNFIKDFEKFDDIVSWLRSQWAGLFADFLTNRIEETSLKDLAAQIAELSGVSAVLKEYTESMMRKIEPENYQSIITEQSKKLRTLMIARFAKEGMIHYLRKNSPKRPGISTVYDAFEKSNSLMDFLKRAKFDTDFVSKFIAQHEEIAKRDYEKLVMRYLNEGNIDSDVED
jgi:hypothetical protein